MSLTPSEAEIFWRLQKNIKTQIELSPCLFSSYFKNRYVVVDGNSCLKYNIGVPQGSSAGSILWLIIMNELLNEFDTNRTYKVIAFADDIIVLLKAKASSHFKELAKEPLDIIHKWAAKFKLKFNVDKSRYTVIKWENNPTHFWVIKFNQANIRYANDIKYQGIIINKNLSGIPTSTT